jgi:methylenetetrahydrofolate reductase (NADPH)
LKKSAVSWKKVVPCDQRLTADHRLLQTWFFAGSRHHAGEPGRVVELADTQDLGSCGAIRAGSSPVAPTKFPLKLTVDDFNFRINISAYVDIMKLVRDIYAAKAAVKKPVISLEFFPPKTDDGDKNLLEKTIPALMQLKPDFCSVTYGAGGTTREKTLAIVDRIQREHGLTAVAHLTCVNHTREQIRELLARIRELGVKNILALRGDPPGGGEFKMTPGGFEYSSQLVRFIRDGKDFSIGVAGFPEGHIACKSGKIVDWSHLKEKIDAGADYVLTQLFFDNADFYEFRDHLTKKLGVSVPIVPGIVSILSATQIRKFTTMCGAKIPSALSTELDRIGDDDAAATEFGIEYATKQCADLLKNGAPGIHFYTLNKAHATTRVLKNLGLA